MKQFLKRQNTIEKLSRKAYAVLLMALLSFSMFAILPFAFGQYTAMPDRDTFTAVGVSPTLIGRGQQVVINVIVYPGPSGPTYEGQTLVGELQEGRAAGYANVSVTISHPDGTQETFMPIDVTLAGHGIMEPGRTQIVGHLMFFYTPMEAGTYNVTASFPGQTYTTDIVSSIVKLSVYYKPSSSIPTTFTVQEEPIEGGIINGAPFSPLPEGYWENPVQTNNREWALISGDWVQEPYNVMATYYNPYSKAPNSPHIIWSRKLADSGLPGGVWGSLPYGQSSSQYRAVSGFSRTDVTIILDGTIYRNGRTGYFEAIDLRTGTWLWEAPGTILQAQRLDVPFQTATQVHEGGIASWLWGGVTYNIGGTGSSSWYRYSTFNGELLQNITNVPRDITAVKFEDGDPIAWVIQANEALWNKTLPLKIPYLNLIKWNYSKLIATQVYSQIYSNDWSQGIEWNISAMQDDFVSIGDSHFRAPAVYPYRDANVVIVRNPNAMQIMAGYDYNTGAFLWKNNQTVLNIDILIQGIATNSSGPHFMRDGASPNNVAYDVNTGQELYRISTGELPWSLLPAYTYVYNNGVIFVGSYDGHVYAYDTTNGQSVWVSDFVGETTETVPGTQPFNGKSVGADGKLYYSSATEYQLMPRTRFLNLVCIDENNGQFLWKLPMGISPRGIADGYLLGEDIDNGLLYVIGKGKTTTTVSAPQTGVTTNSKVLITGTVMDMSPGKPNVPAVADEDMSMWMDYLYGQNATLINNPPMPQGVSVELIAVDANGNSQEIGTATTDAGGTFSYDWTPEIEGKYSILAMFSGSESYWPSFATTSFVAGTTSGSSSQTGAPPTSTDTYIVVGVVAIIIAIAIVGVAILLAIRRKP